MSYNIRPEDVPDSVMLVQERVRPMYSCDTAHKRSIARLLEAAIEAGLVSPPCHYIAYPSGMPVMHESGEPLQIFPGKCTEPHERHWKGQTE